MELREQLKESEMTKISEKLRAISLMIDEVKYGWKSIDEIDLIVNTVEGWLYDSQLNSFDWLMSYYMLSQAYNAKKCLTHDPSQAMFTLIMKELFFIG